MNASLRPPQVVIVGCGFGGLAAARVLQAAAVSVTVIDRHNHHLFQPLLYQVATAGLSAPAIAAPIRHLFRGRSGITTLMGAVERIDAQRQQLSLADGATLAYDHLIVATGASHSYFGHDDWAAHAPGLKTLEDAFEIRKRILLAFEAAEREADPQRRQALLSFVVIGAGPTGVEMAGTLAEIAHHTLPGEFRRIDPRQARILLLEGGERVLQAMPAALSARAQAQLERLGVEVRLRARVTGVDATGVDIAGEPTPQRIDSHCVIWAAGVAASPLARQVAGVTGAGLDRAGRLCVADDLSVPGHARISVIGDLAAAFRPGPDGQPIPVPGVSPAAKQMGRCAARNVLRRIEGRPTEAFRYVDYGNLATIGRHSAVVDLATPLGPLRFHGLPAWLFWLFAHLYFLIGFRNRLVVLLDWAWAYWSFQRHARVVVDPAPAPADAPR